MAQASLSSMLEQWPEDSRKAAQALIRKYGAPDETTPSLLIWRRNGPWKRTIVQRDPIPHDFPKPHTDIVEQVVDYRVPPEKADELARFDGSVVVERTAGELSARCHDEQANFLALNLAHDIIEGQRTVAQARRAYARSMVEFREGKEVPYMARLQFGRQQETADRDVRTISDKELEKAEERGREGKEGIRAA